MSLGLQSPTFRERITGKWQLPLLAVASFLFITTVVISRAKPAVLTIEQRVEQISAFKTGLLLQEAEVLTRSILNDGNYASEELAPIYAELADISFQIEATKLTHEDHDLIRIPAVYEQAELLGHTLDGDAYANRGQAYEWMGRPRKALEQYRLALKHSPTEPLSIYQRALALQLYTVRVPRAQLHDQLNALLLEAQGRPEILKWAVGQKIQMLTDEDRIIEGMALTDEYRSFFENTPYEPFMEYLTAWLQYQAKKYDEAELTLRSLLSKHRVRDETHAQASWLLGTVLLKDGGPQRPMQAMIFFQDVLNSHSVGEYVTACKVGLAEALSATERYDEAWGYYQSALRDLKDHSDTRLANYGEIRSSLTIRSLLQQEAGHYQSALDYLQLATDLVDLRETETRAIYLHDLALLKKLIAELRREQSAIELSADHSEEAQTLGQRSRELFLSAANDFLTFSKLKTVDESTSADALWQAADMFDSAGERNRTIELLSDFLAGHPFSNQIPVALFRLGQAYQAEGELPAAVEQYQKCLREYGRTGPALRSIIPLADCFLMMGPDYAQQAEDTLLYVLEESPHQPAVFTPQSQVYRSSLFKLGELYSRQGRYEEAIEWLDEALQRYPDDQRLARATFLLANAYRHSGLALETAAVEVSNALRREEMLEKKENRLRKAEAYFNRVIEELSEYPESKMSEMQSLQLMLSYMYRANCAFDLAQFEHALNLYQEVVRVYKEGPVTLAAYVQIISSLESLGRVAEVKPALQRAQWLTDKIEPQAFESSLLRNKADDWHKLFAWLSETGGYNNN